MWAADNPPLGPAAPGTAQQMAIAKAERPGKSFRVSAHGQGRVQGEWAAQDAAGKRAE